LRKYLKFILLLLLAVFSFWFFGRNIDWAEVSQSLQKANPIYLIIGVLTICLGYLLRAKRWQVLLEPITETSLKELFATTTVGFTAVFFVGRAGEIVRPMWLPMRDKRVRPSAALVTLAVERIFDLAALISFFAVNLLWIKTPVGREKEFEYVKLIGILMLIGVAFGFLALYLYQRFSEKIIGWFESNKLFQNRIGKIFLSVLRQLATALQILRDWREVMAVVFWTITLWLAIAFPTWMVVLAFGLPMDFSHSLFVMGWAAIGSLVPTPGGAAGAFHAATAGGLMFLGVDKDQAFAIALIMHLIYFAPAVIFGIYYFFHGDISIAKFKSLLSSENAVEEIESDSPDFEEKLKTKNNLEVGHQSKIQNPESKIV
jgi:glycosyltransferase 2 family protein